jgi:hypothetical protein
VAKKPECPKCGERLTDDPHDLMLCRTKERDNLKAENAKLKQSVNDWKDAWFHLRQLVGEMGWSHFNCPHQPTPALSTSPDPFLDFSVELICTGKDVYQRTAAGWRLIGSSTSEEGALSIVRLLH